MVLAAADTGRAGLAARHPGRREEYRRTAEEARKMAHRARESLRDLASDLTAD